MAISFGLWGGVIVAYRVNKEQRVQHRLLIQTVNNLQGRTLANTRFAHDLNGNAYKYVMCFKMHISCIPALPHFWPKISFNDLME
jgi:hypothetical protein